MNAMLLGSVPAALLGDGTPVDSFLLAHPKPSSGQVADLLKAYPADDRTAIAQSLIARGVDARTISSALSWVETSEKIKWSSVWGVAALASAAASAYHGYKRNNSIGWSIWWFFAGSLFPIFTPAIAIAQGFGKPKKS